MPGQRIWNASLLLLLIGCACGPPADPAFEALRTRLLESTWDDFRIADIINSGDGAIVRVNVYLTPPPADDSETRRRTLNALTAVRTIATDDRRVAVWSLDEEALTVRGMAFYSPSTDSTTYKTADEIQ